MRLEGIDPKHQSLFCVLSVAEIQGYRLRLHFDGFSECYDFWCNADSPFIFPVGWCEKNNKPLQPPKCECLWRVGPVNLAMLPSRVIFFFFF